jgi:hypothetical protein
MKKIITPLIIALLLSACATYENTRKPENMTTVVLNAGYQSAYRTIRERLMTECGFDERMVSGNIYSDLKTAELNVQMNGIYYLSVDLRALPDDKTELSHYVHNKSGGYLGSIVQWVNESKRECKMSQ